jgi:hypothetical protein
MAISSIAEGVVEEYLKCIGENLFATTSVNGCFLLTPFIRPDGEAIAMEIGLLPSGDLRISDMGETVGYLFVNGLAEDLAVPDYAHSIARLYGTSFLTNDLTIDSKTEDLGNSVHNLVQSTLAITHFAQGRNSAIPVLKQD